jgi:hypothetical protein
MNESTQIVKSIDELKKRVIHLENMLGSVLEKLGAPETHHGIYQYIDELEQIYERQDIPSEEADQLALERLQTIAKSTNKVEFRKFIHLLEMKHPGLADTLAILTNPEIQAVLEESEADIQAGRTISLDQIRTTL